MDHLRLGAFDAGSADTKPSLLMDPVDRCTTTFVDWCIENGVTEPVIRLPPRARKMVQTYVIDRDTVGPEDDAVAMAAVRCVVFVRTQWARLRSRITPVEMVIAVALFLIVMLLAWQAFEPAAVPALPPLSR